MQEIGLQVPITVYENPKHSKAAFVLLDGERRFRAAKLNNWDTIPALVVPAPTARDNAVRMFNIHMLREDWEEIETAWALEQVIKEMGLENDRELQKITGLSIDRIKNMRRVLTFPRAIQEEVAEGQKKYQLLVELDKNVLSKFRDAKKSAKPVIDMTPAQVRDVFLKKYSDSIEKDIVDLRKVGTLLDTARSGGKVGGRAANALSRLITKPSTTIEEAYETGAASSVEISRVLRDVKALPGRIKDLLDSDLQEDQRDDVHNAIKTLQGRLSDILKKAQS